MATLGFREATYEEGFGWWLGLCLTRRGAGQALLGEFGEGTRVP